MLPMKKFLIVLFFFISSTSISQNVMTLGGAFARPGDTITISVNIYNTNRFISFQFDLPLPSGISFIEYSPQLSSRSTNHVAIGNLVETNRLRIFAYSPSNDPFTGYTGEVITFKLAVGNIRGEFPLLLESAIIGDSLSRNILSGVENGILSVFPLDITESYLNTGQIDFMINPNPLSIGSYIQINISFAADLELRVFNQLGKLIFLKNFGDVPSGEFRAPLPDEFIAELPSGAIYHCILVAWQHEKGRTTAACKVIKM